MATVLMFSLRAVRMTRMAISPLLAMRIFRNGGVVLGDAADEVELYRLDGAWGVES
jgi:hypothetical protein